MWLWTGCVENGLERVHAFAVCKEWIFVKVDVVYERIFVREGLVRDGFERGAPGGAVGGCADGAAAAANIMR